MAYLIAPVSGEDGTLLRYSRSRPRFGLHLAMDAVLSVAIVLGGFHFFVADSEHENADTLKRSGAVAMTGGELVSFLHHENLVAYWAGPRSDSKYTVIATSPDDVTITYFPQKANISQLSAGSLVIQTHHHISSSATDSYAENVSGLGSSRLNQGMQGNAIEYNPANPTRVTLTFKDHFEAVAIFSSIPQAAISLARKPGGIRRID